MLEKTLRGAVAGMAGTSALNAATYGDMVWRGRPASRMPEQMVETLATRMGLAVPGENEERESRLQALGALAGLATGILVGATAGQFRGTLRRLGPVLGPALVGAAAMAATDVTGARLGVSDPRSWDAKSWLSDAVPHLAYGAVTWAWLTG
jgi:hypothetical protein